jgi:hypothetical protein
MDHRFYGASEIQHVIEPIRKLTQGDQASLINAFFWQLAPNGFQYWSDRYYNNVPLSDEDHEFFRRRLEHLEQLLSEGKTMC